MPIKVTITLTQDAEIIRICDRYNNNKKLYPDNDLPVNRSAWDEIPLVQVTTNGSSPPMGKLQITAKVKNEAGEWEHRDEPFTVGSGWHEWPSTSGMVSLVEMLMVRGVPAESGVSKEAK